VFQINISLPERGMFDKDCLLEPILEFDLDCDFGISISVIATGSLSGWSAYHMYNSLLVLGNAVSTSFSNSPSSVFHMNYSLLVLGMLDILDIEFLRDLGLVNDELCEFGPESGLTSIIAYFLGSSSGLSV